MWFRWSAISLKASHLNVLLELLLKCYDDDDDVTDGVSSNLQLNRNISNSVEGAQQSVYEKRSSVSETTKFIARVLHGLLNKRKW